MGKGIVELAQYMRESRFIVVLTGAGMDTESNIPDFRGEGGWWKNIDPRTVANIDTLDKNYPLFQEFYTMRINLLKNVQPHQGHYILSDLERTGVIKSIATQNVSGLHVLAGSQQVYELHGSIKSVRCNQCGNQADIEAFFNLNKCHTCNTGTLRPNVVLFGESLPSDVCQTALSDIRKSDLLIVIGTSLEVSPVNQLPLVAKGKSVFINNENRGADYPFDLRIIGKAKEVLEKLVELF